MGMDPDGGIHEIVLLCEFYSAVESARTVAIADGKNGFDASLTGTGNDQFAIGIELFTIEMSVGIDVHFLATSATLICCGSAVFEARQQIDRPSNISQPYCFCKVMKTIRNGSIRMRKPSAKRCATLLTLLIAISMSSACGGGTATGGSGGGGGGGGGTTGAGTPGVALWVGDAAHSQLLGFSATQIAASGTPTPVLSITASSSGAGVTIPQSMAFDSGGNLWVSNTNASYPLIEYDANQLIGGGALVANVAITTDPLGLLVDPYGLTFDGAKNLWVAVPGKNSLVAFSPAQQEVSGNPTPAIIIQSTFLNGPTAISFDANGNLWVANTGNDELLEFAAAQIGSSGNPFPQVQISSFALFNPMGLAFDSSGNLWVTNFADSHSAGTVVEFTAAQIAATGAIAPTVTLTETTGAEPYGIRFDSSKDLWIANVGAQNVVEFTPSQIQSSGSTAPTVTISGSFQPNAIVFVP